MGNINLHSFFKKETLIVALATALCYTGAYIYERGFSVYFGIPTELISVTPGSIITTVSLFLAFIMALYMMSTIPIVISHSKKNKKQVYHNRIKFRSSVDTIQSYFLLNIWIQNTKFYYSNYCIPFSMH
ncbi:TPA: hypothetical protein MDY08_005129 [Klebsiella pneumoniae]|nr:hypothetical protein [Klebsiella pneumoniae]